MKFIDEKNILHVLGAEKGHLLTGVGTLAAARCETW